MTQYLLIFKVIEDMEKMRQIITDPRSLQLFVAVDAKKLQQNAYSLLRENFLPVDKRVGATER